MKSSFFELYRELDLLKGLTSPNADNYKQLLELINDNDTCVQYFFKERESSALSKEWFLLLYENGVFEDFESDDTNIQKKLWFKAKYIEKVASVYQEEVLKIITRLKPKDTYIMSIILDAL